MHLGNPRQARQVLTVDAGEVVRILDHDLQQIVGRARHQVAFQHIRDGAHAAFEGVQDLVGLTRQGDLDEDRRLAAQARASRSAT